MTLPSSAGGSTTEEVGYFDVEATVLAEWMLSGLESGWRIRPARTALLEEAIALLHPGPEVTRYLCAPVGQWTALLSNGPLGTDVGLLPSYAARELGCRAMRVVGTQEADKYPARVLEVYGPAGPPPLLLERSIVAANDGGKWVFETSGEAYAFEDESAYKDRAKARRFTTKMLYRYLRALDIPVDVEPDWQRSLAVERAP